jgi:hypothetical protein
VYQKKVKGRTSQEIAGMTTAMTTPMQKFGVKGSDVYDSTGLPLLDLSVALVRGVPASTVETCVQRVLASGSEQDMEDLSVMAFHTRAVRGGKGERDAFQHLLQCMDSTLVRRLLSLVPTFGSWRDLFVLADAPGCHPALRTEIVRLTAVQLQADKMSDTPSLLAKWAPRENKHGELAKDLARHMFPEIRQFSHRMKVYRQLVADLNRRLHTVEVSMCGGEWATIVPAHVPGRAGKLYMKAFLNLLPEKAFGRVFGAGNRYPSSADRIACAKNFTQYARDAKEGKVKVHGADTLFPHELVKKMYTESLSVEEIDHLDAVWASMVRKAEEGGGMRRSIFMSDFSGSMQSARAGGDLPYWVSMALGVLGSSVSSGAFRNRFMTFDSTPTWVEFSEEETTLSKRLTRLKGMSNIGEGLSTDFQKAMDLVLATLKSQRVRPGEEPENLIVLTDMGFDAACSSSQYSYYTGNSYRHAVKTAPWQTHVGLIRKVFQHAGEDMWGEPWTPPRIVIWNLAASYTSDFHATADTPGVMMLSGWSPSLFEVLQKEGPRSITPREALAVELGNPRYQPVRDVVRAWASEKRRKEAEQQRTMRMAMAQAAAMRMATAQAAASAWHEEQERLFLQQQLAEQGRCECVGHGGHGC